MFQFQNEKSRDSIEILSSNKSIRSIEKGKRNKKHNLKAIGSTKESIDGNAKIGPKSFSVIKLLGTGSFGEVFLVRSTQSYRNFRSKKETLEDYMQ